MNNIKELVFISDKKLEDFVRQVIDKVNDKTGKVENELNENVIDPFSALFDSMRRGISYKQWMEQEKRRQIQKTFETALGTFHENVLGSMPNWKQLEGKGIDLINNKSKIIAEIKNKHNTMNSGKTEQVYRLLHQQVSEDGKYGGYTAYLVVIVPKKEKPYDKKWVMNSKNPVPGPRDTVREIDGDSFYAMASGESDALYKLYRRLPIILEKLTKNKRKSYIDDPIYTDLFKTAYKKYK